MPSQPPTDPEQMVARFRDHLTGQIADIERIASNTPWDLAALAEATHKLGGGSGQLGLRRLSALAIAADQLAVGVRDAGRPMTGLEHAQMRSLLAEIASARLTTSHGGRGVLLYGFDPPEAAGLMDALETAHFFPEIAHEGDELADFEHRAPEGVIAATAPVPDADRIGNAVVLFLDDAEIDLPSHLYDVILRGSDRATGFRMAFQALQVPVPMPVRLSGFDAGIERCLAVLLQRYGDLAVGAAGRFEIAPGATAAFDGRRLSLPVPFDPHVALRLAARVARHLV